MFVAQKFDGGNIQKMYNLQKLFMSDYFKLKEITGMKYLGKKTSSTLGQL